MLHKIFGVESAGEFIKMVAIAFVWVVVGYAVFLLIMLALGGCAELIDGCVVRWFA